MFYKVWIVLTQQGVSHTILLEEERFKVINTMAPATYVMLEAYLSATDYRRVVHWYNDATGEQVPLPEGE